MSMTRFAIIKDWEKLPPPPYPEAKIYNLMGPGRGSDRLDYVGYALQLGGAWYAIVQQRGDQMAEVVGAGPMEYDVPAGVWYALRQEPALWRAVDEEYNARVYRIIRERYSDPPSEIGNREIFIAHYKGRESLIARRGGEICVWRSGWPPAWFEIARWEPRVECMACRLPRQDYERDWLPALAFAASPDVLEALGKLLWWDR